MNWQFNCRVLSLLVTVILITGITERVYWLALVIGFGFVHYALAFYYARQRIVALLTDTSAWLPLISIAAFCTLLYYTKFPLMIYFGFHHAFNEAYVRRFSVNPGVASGQQDTSSAGMAPALCLLHLAAYFAILRDDHALKNLPEETLWLFLALAVAFYLRQWWALAGRRGVMGMVRDSGPELGLLALVGVSLTVDISFLQMVLYHFVLWTFMPLPAMKEKGQRTLIQYVVLSVASMLLVYGALISLPQGFTKSVSFGLGQFYLWSYIHITASFALSSAHPQWLVGMFPSTR